MLTANTLVQDAACVVSHLGHVTARVVPTIAIKNSRGALQFAVAFCIFMTMFSCLQVGAPDIVSGYCPPEGGSSMDRLVSSMDRNNSSAAADSLKGCNVVQELSITLNTATCSQTDK